MILLPVHPASFVHNFVSGMQSFYFSKSQDAIVNYSIAHLSLKMVFWTHKFGLNIFYLYTLYIKEGPDGGVWYSLFIKNLAHYSSH